MLLLDVDHHARTPVFEQIYTRIMRLVDEGTLLPGARLPATRRLAAALGVNRTTVFRAYQELWARGYIESRPGSYSLVRRPGQLQPHAGDRDRGEFAWCNLVTERSRHAHEALLALSRRPAPGEDVVDFQSLMADRDLCPADKLRCAVKHVLVKSGKDLLGYGDPQGVPALREVIARRLCIHGIQATPEEVLVTPGSQPALDLVLRTLTRPDDAVVVEAPTYSMAHPLFRMHDLRVLEIPMLAEGLDLDTLDRTVAAHRPKLVYTMPNFQNPTGITTSQSHRERLLAICQHHRVPLVEDGFEEEMKYFGKAVLPIASMDREGLVIYLGTFSKVVFSGLRVGWIMAHADCIQHLLAAYRFSSLSGNTLGQAALARFCATGQYEAHLRRLHRAYRTRMHAMLRGLATHLPTGVEWTRPAGGYTLWVQLPGLAMREDELIAHLWRHGLAVAPGNSFFATPRPSPAFRLSIANLSVPRIAEGCRRLGVALSCALEDRHAA